jgi:hypothetical protein
MTTTLKRHCPLRLAIFASTLAFVCFTPSYVSSQVRTSMKLSTAESRVLVEVIAGRDIDLIDEFGEQEENRVLSAAFLQKLLTDSIEDIKIGRGLIRISNGVVNEPLDLEKASIPYELRMEDFIFKSTVSFANSTVAGDLALDGSHFLQLADFEDIEVKGDGFFRRAVFEGPAIFVDAHIMKFFEVSESQFKNKQQAANFESLEVDGQAQFRYVKFEGPYSLRDMRYEYIEANPNSWKSLMALVNNSTYSVDVYRRLETFVENQGYPDRAKETYIAQKRRERRERLTGFAWLASVFLDVSVGFGKRPELALIYSLIIVLLGYFVFHNRRGMEPQKSEYASRSYNPVWYSLDLFVPFLSLQVENIWMPRSDRRFARNYVYLHTLLGWILIPVGLAALTGIIK